METGVEEGNVVLLDVGSNGRRVVADFWFPGFAWPVYSPDGELVAGYSRDARTPTVIDVETGSEVATMLRACETPRAIDRTNRWILVDGWCPEESQTAADSGSRTGFVDYSTGELVAGADTDEVFAAAIGPPDTLAADVVAYTTRNDVVFRRASTFELITKWPIPGDVITLTVDFSPDGSAIGVSSQARQGIVFDVAAILAGAHADDAVVVFPEMHTGPTHRVVPVGDSIFTTGANTQVRRWDAATGALLVDLSTKLGEFVHLFALPDGEVVFYADANGVLRRYLTDPDDLVALARSRVQRDFTEVECSRFFSDGDCPTLEPRPPIQTAIQP